MLEEVVLGGAGEERNVEAEDEVRKMCAEDCWPCPRDSLPLGSSFVGTRRISAMAMLHSALVLIEGCQRCCLNP